MLCLKNATPVASCNFDVHQPILIIFGRYVTQRVSSNQKITWLIDWVKVLDPTWHKIGHFRDVPQASLLAWYGKTKPNKANITKAYIQQSKEIYYNIK